MAGFDAVGEFAIGEFEEDSDAVVSVAAPGGFTFAANAPEVAAGATVDVPAISFTFAATAPSIAAGARVDVPAADAFVLAAPVPLVAAGARIDVPAADAFVLAASAPSIAAGARIDVLPFSPGDYTDSAVAEFAVAEGDDPVGTDFRFFARVPEIFAGARIDVPTAAAIALSTNAPEIRARRRAVRVQLITA